MGGGICAPRAQPGRVPLFPIIYNVWYHFDKYLDELNELYPDQTNDVKDETEYLDYSKALPFVLNKFLR